MVDVWHYSYDGRLHFAYRGRNWSTSPPRFLNATEMPAVTATAHDEAGNPVTVAQQPSYVAALGGYVGWLLPSDVEGKRFVSITLTPTAGPGIPVNWLPARKVDISIEAQLAESIATSNPADVEHEGFEPVH